MKISFFNSKKSITLPKELFNKEHYKFEMQMILIKKALSFNKAPV
jgi:hypothetical protein